MPNKTITAIIATVIIVVTNLLTIHEQTVTYTGLVIIAALGGVSIFKNGGIIK